MRLALGLATSVLFCGLVYIGIQVRAVPDRGLISAEELIALLKNDDIKAIAYEAQSKEVSGYRRSGGRFVVSGPLTSEAFDLIISKKLSSSLFLGEVVGFQENAEFTKVASITKTSDTTDCAPFRVGEQQTLGLEVLGLEAGQITLSVVEPVTLNGIRACRFRIQADTREDFSLYSVHDSAETVLRKTDFQPLALMQSFQETKHIGAAQFFYALPKDEKPGEAVKVRAWKNGVRSNGKRYHETEELNVQVGLQNAASLLFYLRTKPLTVGSTETIRLHEGAQTIEVRARVVRREALSFEGESRAAVQVKVDAFDLRKPDRPIALVVWMSDDPHHYLLKIDSILKFGKIRAQLQKLIPGAD